MKERRHHHFAAHFSASSAHTPKMIVLHDMAKFLIEYVDRAVLWPIGIDPLLKYFLAITSYSYHLTSRSSARLKLWLKADYLCRRCHTVRQPVRYVLGVRNVETAIPPHPSSPHPPSGCTAASSAASRLLPNRRAWRSGSMVHWWLRSYKDTDYCIKHKDKSNERIMLRLTQTPPRSTT